MTTLRELEQQKQKLEAAIAEEQARQPTLLEAVRALPQPRPVYLQTSGKLVNLATAERIVFETGGKLVIQWVSRHQSEEIDLTANPQVQNIIAKLGGQAGTEAVNKTILTALQEVLSGAGCLIYSLDAQLGGLSVRVPEENGAVPAEQA